MGPFQVKHWMLKFMKENDFGYHGPNLDKSAINTSMAVILLGVTDCEVGRVIQTITQVKAWKLVIYGDHLNSLYLVHHIFDRL